ncbi:MAG: UDP-glucose 4-epimerase GalE, partial [Zetaproteobacteria bacterium]
RALVTGGAGYIGAHMAADLLCHGWDVAVVDDLSTGHRSAVPENAIFFQGSITDAAFLARVFAAYRPEVVFHFAALAVVCDSFERPFAYWQVNVEGTIKLLHAMDAHGVDTLVFSSSCAVYGHAEYVPIDEKHPTRPASPYGATKLAAEQCIQAACHQFGLRAVALRYFNVAGCCGDASRRERHDPETHLFPNLLAAAEKKQPFILYGADHPTPDGTAIRDFVHVLDLVEAHRQTAIRLLQEPSGFFEVFNLGSGKGTSVREAITAVEHGTGTKIKVITHPRRRGDPPMLVANSQKWQNWAQTFGFQRTIEDMVRSMWRARRR